MIGIYKIISPSGKIYIGQSIDIDRRWKEHISMKDKGLSKLKNSILKYGSENHIFEIIEECEIEILNDREGYWQDHYESVRKGLNCFRTKTTDRSGYMCEESKLKLSNSRKAKPDINFKKRGIPLSDEHKNAISRANKGNYHSDETKLKISKSRIGKSIGEKHYLYGGTINEKSRKIFSEIRKKATGLNNLESKIVIDLNTGIYYYSISEAAYYNNVDKKQISGHRINKTMLRIAEDYEMNIVKEYIRVKRKGKQITNGFKIYNSIEEYCKQECTNRKAVSKKIINKELKYV